AGGMHGSNRLGGNSLSDLLVFGKRAGEYAAAYADQFPLGSGRRPKISEAAVAQAVDTALAPLNRDGGENPYALQQAPQEVMNSLVGIIRRESELVEALKRLEELKARVAKVSATGGRAYNPAWHLALDLRNMVLVSECTAKAALTRQESRGGHTRDDYPDMDPQWRKVNLACSLSEDGSEIRLERVPVPPMPPELISLFDRAELEKYLTEEELSGLTPKESTR